MEVVNLHSSLSIGGTGAIDGAPKRHSASKLLRYSILGINDGEMGSFSLTPSNRLLKDLSTWGIGGPCKYLVDVTSERQLLSAAGHCSDRSIPFLILGNGSNCLFHDLGFHGCVIVNRAASLRRLTAGDGLYRAGSGYPINRLAVECSGEGFSGLEFAAGVPGTVGGAVYMNAGAHGQCTADAIDSVEIVTVGGGHRVLRREELAFGYRTSPFQCMNDLAAILSVTFRLKRSDPTSARSKLEQFNQRKRRLQPTKERSAGSVFRNPAGVGLSAGELIEKAGLKGVQVGGAKISELHANFFINCDGSTSKDMTELINLAKYEVDRKFGIMLKEEIVYVPPYCDHQTSS